MEQLAFNPGQHLTAKYARDILIQRHGKAPSVMGRLKSGAEPAYLQQPRDALGILAIRLDRHRLRRALHLPGLPQRALGDRPMVPGPPGGMTDARPAAIWLPALST